MLCECKVYFCWCSQVCPGGWWAGLGIPECDKIPESGAGAGAGPVLALILSSLPVYHQTILASNVKQSRYGYYGNYYGNVNVYHIIGWFVNIACIVKLNLLQRVVEVERKISRLQVFSDKIFSFSSNCEDI